MFYIFIELNELKSIIWKQYEQRTVRKMVYWWTLNGQEVSGALLYRKESECMCQCKTESKRNSERERD